MIFLNFLKFHSFYFREARWDLPPGEELIDLNAVVVNNEDSLQNPLLLQQRRAEFKRQVSALVAKCIEAYRKVFIRWFEYIIFNFSVSSPIQTSIVASCERLFLLIFFTFVF